VPTQPITTVMPVHRVLATTALVLLMTVGAAALPVDLAAAGTGASVVQQDDSIPPQTTHDRSPPYVMITLTTVFVAGGCLYLLFRRGSIAYRARGDEQHDTGHDS
jgi:hypothetical protein